MRISTNQCEWLSTITESRVDEMFLDEMQINEVTTETIAHKKRFLEALGRKLYNRKFSLPPVPNTVNEGIIIPLSLCSVVHDNHGNDICLEMLFRLPIYGDMAFENIE